MMFRGLMRLGAANREPVVDNHPLARPDGGWYPGKRFDPTDILTDPGNWLVWKQFLIFFLSILIVPVAVFVVSEWALREYFALHFQQSQTIGALVSVVCIQGLMYYYARLAFTEDKADISAAAAAAAKIDQAPLNTQAAPVQIEGPPQDTASPTQTETAPVRAEPVEASEEVETCTAPSGAVPAGGETSAVQRRVDADLEVTEQVVEDKKDA